MFANPRIQLSRPHASSHSRRVARTSIFTCVTATLALAPPARGQAPQPKTPLNKPAPPPETPPTPAGGENAVAAPQGGTGASTDGDARAAAARAAEEAEIRAELERLGQASPSATSPYAPPPPTDARASGSTASSRGLSNLTNPAISVNGLGLGGGTTRPESAPETAPEDLRSGLFLQEVEFRASAIVDPFFRADVSLAGNAEEIGFEEAYVTTLELPRVTLRAGQMKAAFGRHNVFHTPLFPFITAPLPWRALVGPEGLNDPGVSAEVLLPLPFFAEITGQAFAGEWAMLEGGVEDDPLTAADETVPDRRRDRDLAYLGHLKTLFDLGDPTTLELGASFVGGRNGFSGFTKALAADLTVKWKPLEAARYTGLEWTSEYVWVDRELGPVDARRGGGYTALRYQFLQQWWVQGRGALLGLPAQESPRIVRGEALVAFVPSEFSAIRFQYAIEKEDQSEAGVLHEAFAQIVFSIGSHPAHAY